MILKYYYTVYDYGIHLETIEIEPDSTTSKRLA